MPKVNDVASMEVVLRRWIYSELTSPRFHGFYRDEVPQSLFDCANGYIPYEALDAADQQTLDLVGPWPRGGLFKYFRENCAGNFRCVLQNKVDIQSCRLVPDFDPPGSGRLVTMREFLSSYGKRDDFDPRTAADWYEGVPLQSEMEPIIIVPAREGPLILEGTGRSVLFLGPNNVLEKIKAWVPVQ